MFDRTTYTTEDLRDIQAISRGFVLNNALMMLLFLTAVVVALTVFGYGSRDVGDEKDGLISQALPGTQKLKEAREQVNPKAIFTEVEGLAGEIIVKSSDITPEDTPETYLSSVHGECALENCLGTIAGEVQSVNGRELTLLAQLEAGELLTEPKRLSIFLPETITVRYFNLETFVYIENVEDRDLQQGDNIEIAVNEQGEIVSATVVVTES